MRKMYLAIAFVLATSLATATSWAQTLVDVRVADGDDDAEERQSGSVKRSSSDLELVDDGTRLGQTIGIRFNGVAIPPGATIDAAYIQFTVDETDSGMTSVTVYGQAEANPLTFSSAHFDITTRPLTANSVDWLDIPAWNTRGVAGMNQQTPDLSTIVQEIIGDSAWAGGNSMVFIIEGSGERTAEAFNGVAASAPLLHVEFNGGGGGSTNQPPTQFDVMPAVMENSLDGVVVAMLDNVIDPDPDMHFYAMIDGAGGRFDVVGNELVVLNGLLLDYETATSHTVVVEACDNGEPVLCVQQSVTIAVLDDTTEPPPPPVTSVTFGNTGDYGRGNEYNIAVASVLRGMGAEFVTTNGDNRYGNETMESAVGLAYGDFVAAGDFFPSIGNHDYGDGGGIDEYLAYFDLLGNERYFSVVRGPVEIFIINSEPQEPDGGGDYPSIQGTWFASAMAASTASWQFVFMHRPPFSSGSNHGSSSRMQRWPFEELGIDAVFAGHDHTYERIHRDENGDGVFVPYFVNGLGRNTMYQFGTPVAGSQVRFNSEGGGMIVHADENTVTFEFWTMSGVLIDTHTISHAVMN